jgi:hypothetical protein
MGAIPQNLRSVVCGDWNARIGERSPTIGETTIPRKSLDKQTGTRTEWVISTCEQHGWYILNGMQPGPPAKYTFSKNSKESCIDLVMATDATQDLDYDPNTLNGLSDHVMTMTKIKLPHIK